MTALVLLAATAIAAPVPKDGKADEEFAKKVNTARENAVRFLKEKQQKDGSWEGGALKTLAGMDGGQTALATLALLEAGVPANDPAVAKAVEYLVKLDAKRTYVASLTIQVLARTKEAKHLPHIQSFADWLMKEAIMKGKKLEGWSYPGNTITDGSNTHFAVMGLHAAAQAGAKVDAEVWKQVREMYAETQQRDGGWVYHGLGDAKPTYSMTAAALLGLTVAGKYDKNAMGPDPAFEKGMALLLGGKLAGSKSEAYNWLTTAELGRALGSTEFKSGKLTKAWYREGAEKLVKDQQRDGSWKAGEKGLDSNHPVISTACGLYFLSSVKKK
jgi:hypothetical protein